MEESAGGDDLTETLDEAWACAAEADPELQAARFAVLSQTERIRAANALRYPNVGIGSSYTIRTDDVAIRSPLRSRPFLPGSLPFIQDEGAALGGLVSIPVYTGGHITSSAEAAEYGEASADAAVQSLQLELKLSVARTYLAVLEAERIVQTTEKSRQSLEAHLQNVEQLHGQEMVPQTDVLDARSALTSAKRRCLSAENELFLAKAEYNRRLGRPLVTPVRLQEPRFDRVTRELTSLVNAAIRGRSDLAQMSLDAQAMRKTAEATEAMNRPQVYIDAAYWFDENRYRTPEGVGSFGVAAFWNIYDGKNHAHEAAAQLLEANALERRRVGQARDIEIDIYRKWFKRAEEDRLIEEMTDSVRVAEENLNNVIQRYQVGMATNAEVLAAEAKRIQFWEKLHRARYRAILAELELRKAAGIL